MDAIRVALLEEVVQLARTYREAEDRAWTAFMSSTTPGESEHYITAAREQRRKLDDALALLELAEEEEEA